MSDDPNTLCATVPEEFAGSRLDLAVLGCVPIEVTRSRLGTWIRDGRVRVDGAVMAEPGDLVTQGQELALRPPRQLIPEAGSALEPKLIYEDETLAILDKPAGLVMHGTSLGDRQASVASWLVSRYGPNLPIAQGADRPGIVHRLDRDTSGVCIVAFKKEAFEDLMQQFAERTVPKEYRALVYGVPRFESDWIEKRLSSDPRRPNRVKITRSYDKGTRDAATFWQVLERFDGFSVLRLRPKTGRKHQLRAHLCSIEHPIVGDPHYRAKNYGVGMMPDGHPDVERTLLHAHAIRFEHPTTGETVTFRSEPPEDFESVLAFLHENCPA